MAVTVLSEDIGTLSTLSTQTVDAKEIPVTYEVEYNSSSYFVDVIVNYTQNMDTGGRYLKSLTFESLNKSQGISIEVDFDDPFVEATWRIYQGISKGLINVFPGLSLSGVEEIAIELTEKIENRLAFYSIVTGALVF